MAITFNADEIYNIAEQIERNGQKFYSDSAERVKEPSATKVLQDLADMEAEHLKTFQALHAKLSEQARQEITWDPDGEAGAYLQAAADSHV
ncbi:MAG: rubrerythrin, partial [Phycisphaerae bacterium]|nr:rubrerythrin [Phycisphaerae bacterium]